VRLYGSKFIFKALALFLVLSGHEVCTNAQALPSGWSDGDIGSTGVAGSATYSNGTITVHGAGSQIYGTTDAFNFAYQSLSGDGTIVARVVSFQGGSSNREAGVMIRETLGAQATNAAVVYEPYFGSIYFDIRSTTGGTTSGPANYSTTVPYWVKATRSGNSFSAYVSGDGVYWAQVGTSQTITMAQNVYIGLAVTSGSTTASATATFDNVSVSTAASPAPAITSLSATTGSIGSQVVISGSGFGSSQGSSTVYLNGAAVTVNSWSATSITITIPSGATSGLMGVAVAPSMNQSNSIYFAVTTQPLPAGWLDQDVGLPGNVGPQGSATFSSGVFTIKGAGRGITSGSSDGMHFVYQPLSGDGSIIARVTNLQSGSNAVVMIRETLDPSAKDASAYYLPNQAYLYYRTSAGGSVSSQTYSLTASNFPFWVRLNRNGNSISGAVSLDGMYWTEIVPSQTITMAQNVYVGLAVTGTTNTLATGTFDNVSVSSPTNPGPVITSVSATTGAIGSQAVISGSGFGSSQGNSTVYLNSASVTINSWSATSITITIPSGASTGLLAVAVAPSMTQSNPIQFVVETQPLPSTWLDEDVGQPGTLSSTGSAAYSSGTFTMKGSGQGGVSSNGVADAMHFAYQPLSGNGTIIARVGNIQGGSNNQVGVMIRESLTPTSTSAFVFFQPNQAYLNYRLTTGTNASQQSTGFTASSYPYWVKLTRSGNTFSGYISLDGVSWTQVGSSQTISMAQSTYIGLAASSSSGSSLVTTTFDSVSISSDILAQPVITTVSATTGNVGSQVVIYGSGFNSTQGNGTVILNGAAVTVNSWSATSITITIPTGATSGYLQVLVGASMNGSNAVVFTVTSQPLPSGWLDADVGPVSTAGSATYSGSTFTINASGMGFWWTPDKLHFVYQSLSGDGTIIARVASLNGTPMAGVMARETLSASATDAVVFFQPNTAYLAYRATTGGSISSVSGSMVGSAYPYWVKLARVGNTFTGFASLDGVSWIQTGTAQTITMAQTISIGIAAGGGSGSPSAQFDNVSIQLGTMPIISKVSPGSGGIGSSVTVNGTNFGSTQGTSTLSFNGTAATIVTTWTNSQIVATVPSNATSGTVTVAVNSIQSNTNFSFTIFNPVLSGVSPPASQINGTLTLTGTGFGLSQNDSQVKVNGVVASIGYWSDTSIKIFVPSNVSTGTGPLTVMVGGVTSNSMSFTVLEALSVTGMSPLIGPAGTPVTITGTGFGPTQSTSVVDFWGTPANVTSWSDTQIVATVPVGALSGPIHVQVASLVVQGPALTKIWTVQLTDSKGNITTYTSALIGGKWVPTVGQGSGCSSCSQRGNISHTYDAVGNVLSRTDENGNTTTYTYTGNNVHTVTVPISSGHTATTTYTYNSFSEVLTATDPLGNVTTNTYDTNGNLLSVTTPAPGNGASASLTQFAYDTKGELTRITDPLGNQTNIAYFSTGLIQTITDAQSHVTTYAYDGLGNRTSVTDANNKQTTFTYDAMSRLTKITYPDTTTTQFGYDYRGRRTSVTDQNSKQTTYAYDDADRLTSVTDAATNVTTYGYDTESNLTSIKDANQNTTTFDHDAFGRVTTAHFPSGYIEQYAYDNVGNLNSKTDRKNQQITYTYDQLNRLGKKTYPDTTTVNYTYDDDSRLTQVSDPTGTYQFTFDNMGRLTGTTTSYAFLTGRNFTTGYGYDAASNRTSFTDPESGSTAYVYDTLNRLQTLTPPAAISGGSFGFGYDPLSRRTSLTRPNTVNTSYSYDNLSRLLSVTHAKGGVTLDGATYTLDNAGNRNSKADLYASVTTNYGYDNIYELLSATQGTSTTESYTYDPVGNRLSNLSGSGWSNNTSNELTSRPGVTYTYDNNGNTLTKSDSTGTTSYAWDFENRLTSVTLPGSGGTVSFKYDPFGRRIYKSSASGASIYVYDGDNLIEEANSSGTAIARYTQTNNIDEPLAELRSTTTSYYEADGIGSITSLSNATGALAQTYTFDSFGNQTASSGSLTNPFRYTAREFDSETNLQFSRARYYDPVVGRFMTEDPIRFKGGGNFYRYTSNSPVVLNDPLGLKSCVWVGDSDLFSYTTNENPRNGPYYLAGTGKGDGSRGPWEGGASANTPAGVTPRGGVPFARNNCMWRRDRTYDQIRTTIFVRKYICFDFLPCGKFRFWPEFEVSSRRELADTFTITETTGFTLDQGTSTPILIRQDCESLGPPNN
jgi:RHS repeat-associated protein